MRTSEDERASEFALGIDSAPFRLGSIAAGADAVGSERQRQEGPREEQSDRGVHRSGHHFSHQSAFPFLPIAPLILTMHQ